MSFGTLKGDAGVGTHGGSEDHAAILAGTPGQLSAFAFVPMRPAGRVVMPDELALRARAQRRPIRRRPATRKRPTTTSRAARRCCSSSGTARTRRRHRSAPSLDAGRRSRHCGIWCSGRRSRNGRPTCSGSGSSTSSARMPASPRRSTRFARPTCRALGALADSSQADAEHLLGNQVPETIALARLAREAGRVRGVQLRRGVRRQRVGAGGSRCRGLRGTMAGRRVCRAPEPACYGTVVRVWRFVVEAGDPATDRARLWLS